MVTNRITQSSEFEATTTFESDIITTMHDGDHHHKSNSKNWEKENSHQQTVNKVTINRGKVSSSRSAVINELEMSTHYSTFTSTPPTGTPLTGTAHGAHLRVFHSTQRDYSPARGFELTVGYNYDSLVQYINPDGTSSHWQFYSSSTYFPEGGSSQPNPNLTSNNDDSYNPNSRRQDGEGEDINAQNDETVVWRFTETLIDPREMDPIYYFHLLQTAPQVLAAFYWKPAFIPQNNQHHYEGVARDNLSVVRVVTYDELLKSGGMLEPEIVLIPSYAGWDESIFLTEKFFQNNGMHNPCVLCHGRNGNIRGLPANSFYFPGGPEQLKVYVEIKDNTTIFTDLTLGGITGRALATGPKRIPKGLSVPQGLTAGQFRDAQRLIRNHLGDVADDVVVQGSRARGTAKTMSDIDFGLLVSSEEFSNAIRRSFPSNPSP